MTTTVTSTTDTPEQVAAALEPAKPAAEAAPPVPPVAGEAAPAAAEGSTPAAPAEGEPAAAAAPPAEPEAPEGEDDDVDVTEQPKKSDRIGRLKFQRYQAKQEAERVKAENARLQRLVEDVAAGRAPAKEPETPAQPERPKFSKPKPKLENFETIEAWAEQLNDWTRESVTFDIEQQNRETAQRAQAEAIQRSQQQLIDSHLSRVAKYSEAHPEFPAILERNATNPPVMTQAMSMHIFHSEQGPALMEYFDAHRDEAERISKLPLGPAMVALGKIEAKLETVPPVSSGAPAAPPVRRTPVPPTPIKPLGGGSATAVTKPVEDMTQAEFKAFRKSQGAR